MAIRGRGERSRGRGRNDRPQPSQPHIGSPPPQLSQPHVGPPPPQLSPRISGSTSTTGPLTTGGQSAAVPGPIGGQSSAQPTPVPDPVNPAITDPTLVPSSAESLTETDRRPVISVEAVSKPRRFVPSEVTRDITKDILIRMSIPADKWKEYPGQVKDILFNDFKDKYKFATPYDLSMARTVWERTCKDRYPDLLAKAREAAFKQVNSHNYVDLKGHGPRGMKTEVWDGLVEIWVTPKWQKKSEAGRRNRASLPDSMLHTGGSISFGEHKKKMEAELKRPVSFRDMYDRVHKKKTGEYVSERSKKIIESYDTAIVEKYGQDCSTYPIVDADVWLDAAGPSKRGRVHGTGNSLEISAHDSSSSFEATGPSRGTPFTEVQITQVVNAALSSFVQTQLFPLLSRIPGFQAGSAASDGPSQDQVAGEDQANVGDDDLNLD